MTASCRHKGTCIACRSTDFVTDWSLTSPFFARRALLSAPFCVPFIKCLACGTGYFDLFVSDIELGRLYKDYRGESYLAQRHGFEPRYTAALNAALGGEADMVIRRRVLDAALADAGISGTFENVLDHGGDRGQMLADLPAGRKAVYDVSGVQVQGEAERIDETEMRRTRWDLVLSCHVLEHLTLPSDYLNDLRTLGGKDTVFFFEVPNETFRSSRFNRSELQRRWMCWLANRRAILNFFDYLSSGFHVRMGRILPFMFLPLTEHLTFFSLNGLQLMLKNHGMKILFAGIGESGHIVVVSKKDMP